MKFNDPLKKYTHTLSNTAKQDLRKLINEFDDKYKLRLPINLLKQLLINLNLFGFDIKWTQKDLLEISSLKKSQKSEKIYPILIVLDNGNTVPSSTFVKICWSDNKNKYILKIIN